MVFLQFVHISKRVSTNLLLSNWLTSSIFDEHLVPWNICVANFCFIGLMLKYSRKSFFQPCTPIPILIRYFQWFTMLGSYFQWLCPYAHSSLDPITVLMILGFDSWNTALPLVLIIYHFLLFLKVLWVFPGASLISSTQNRGTLWRVSFPSLYFPI